MNIPKITYPLGGQSVVSNEIEIKWDDFSQNNNHFYEIFFSNNWNTTSLNWKLIAIIPSKSKSYVWEIPGYIRSDMCRLAIRIRYTAGQYSEMSLSDVFSIRKTLITPPVILYPSFGEKVSGVVNIIVADDVQTNYALNLYVSSQEAGIPKTLIYQNIPHNIKQLQWDTRNLPATKDYVLEAFYSNDLGDKSTSLFVNNISVSNEGTFIIDTTPPDVLLTINNNDTFTRNRNISVNIFAKDAVTNVHSLVLISGTKQDAPDSLTSNKSFLLDDIQGAKYLQCKIQDFGGNIPELNGFDVHSEVKNIDIIDMTFDPNTEIFWIIGSKDNSYYLYNYVQFLNKKISFADQPTAVSTFDSSVYVASINSRLNGQLSIFSGKSLIPVKEFVLNDSRILCMSQYKDKLYLGMMNGRIYAFDGNSFTLVGEFANSITKIFTDNSYLYAIEKHSDDIKILNNGTFA